MLALLDTKAPGRLWPPAKLKGWPAPSLPHLSIGEQQEAEGAQKGESGNTQKLAGRRSGEKEKAGQGWDTSGAGGKGMTETEREILELELENAQLRRMLGR